MKELIMQGLNVLVQIIILGVGSLIIKYLQKKLDIQKTEQVYDTVKKTVQAAEMVYIASGQGDEKKAWALEKLSNMLGSKLTQDEINTLLESAVHEMNVVLKNGGLTIQQ